ncbi:MAG: heat-inducible transcriptional repressor HrcA [Spirulinaceae cyanobacterium SM2_1_0]|nr:heat-inducible transcriptional repressor HrcA [Spirulinaceae cyanobacterium SM2_1_0]
MSQRAKLNERYQHVLWATIRHYVATAEPVGSKKLIEEYDFRVSSATIRNVMGSLEKEGFLYQPHTSAGRVPSDSGYRVYVDELMVLDETPRRQLQETYAQQLDWGAGNLDVLLQGAAQILATLSGQIALILLPQTNRLRHLQLVQLGEQQIALVVMTDAYQTQSLLVDLPAIAGAPTALAEGELQLLSNFLNHKLRGRSLSEIANLDWGDLDREFEHYADVLRLVLTELTSRQQNLSTQALVVRGVSDALRQPEFSQLEQVQMLLHLLEVEQSQLLPLIYELPELAETKPQRVTVRIGAENSLEPLNTCALISANYFQRQVPVGSVGLLGPTRMIYENAVVMVEATADYLSEALS